MMSEDGAEESSVSEYLAGRSVLVTGGTGFVGKVLVRRLLEVSPRVHRLYLLVRHKHGRAPLDRLAELKQSPALAGLGARQLDKVRAVEGEAGLPRLGVGAAGEHRLRHVSVVINAAASLRFEEPLERAVRDNVRSVVGLLELCDRLEGVRAVVHVSTAYSNAELEVVEERVYRPPLPPRLLLRLVEALPPAVLARITPRLIAPKPNTYTFTKAVAESVVQEHAPARYALSIFRPSIVVCAARSPRPGWVEGVSGASGAVCGAVTGVLHVVRCRGDARADLVPVDIAVDTLIAAAWETTTDARVEEVRVYNCCSENPVTWAQFAWLVVRAARSHPSAHALCYPYGLLVHNYYVFRACEWFLQTAPLHCAAFVTRLCGIRTRVCLSEVSGRLRWMVRVLSYFTTREWHFMNGNVVQLRARLAGGGDARLLALETRTFRWSALCDQYVLGVRRHVLREEVHTGGRGGARAGRGTYPVVWCGVLLATLALLATLLTYTQHSYGIFIRN